MPNKEYAYFIKGQRIGLIERDVNTSQVGQTLSQPPLDLPLGRGAWKSPLESVTDGLEIEYTYNPTYHINDLDETVGSTGYTESAGLLQINGTFTFTAGDYLVVSNSEKFNGLHKVNTTVSGGNVVLTTKYNGDMVEEVATIHIDVDVLSDESDEIPLSSYLAKALVYYVKGRLAEDQLDLKSREYFLKEFRKMMERQENARAHGSRRVMPGNHAIR